jgi:hypothetical protein
MSIISFVTLYLRKFGILPTLSFDQQVWGAKTIMDLYQMQSEFFQASADANGVMQTYWLGSQDHDPYRVSIDPNGHAAIPVYDASPVGECEIFSYPPQFSCAQAQAVVARTTTVEPWTHCELKKAPSTVSHPVYRFSFLLHEPVEVDATTGQIVTV